MWPFSTPAVGSAASILSGCRLIRCCGMLQVAPCQRPSETAHDQTSQLRNGSVLPMHGLALLWQSLNTISLSLHSCFTTPRWRASFSVPGQAFPHLRPTSHVNGLLAHDAWLGTAPAWPLHSASLQSATVPSSKSLPLICFRPAVLPWQVLLVAANSSRFELLEAVDAHGPLLMVQAINAAARTIHASIASCSNDLLSSDVSHHLATTILYIETHLFPNYNHLHMLACPLDRTGLHL
jgi:hypothetical protein